MQEDNEKKQNNYFYLGNLEESDKTFNITIGGRGNGRTIQYVTYIEKLLQNKEFKLCQFSARILRLILEDIFTNYSISCKRHYFKDAIVFTVYFMSDNFSNYYTLTGDMVINDVISTLKEIIPNGKEEK